MTLSSCSPPCDEGNYLGTVEECSVTADAASDGGSTGGFTGGSSGGSTGGSTGWGGDTTALTVQSVTPANNVTINAVTDNITVAFSEAMQSSTIDNTTITLTTSNGTTVPTTVSYSNNVATINPNVPKPSSLGAWGSKDGSLPWNDQYTVNVSTGVKDAAGNALASAYTSSFTTPALPIPTNFRTTVLDANRIRVNWDDVNAGVPGTGYYVWKGTISGGSCSYPNSNFPSSGISGTSSSYKIWTGLTSATTYYFKIQSVYGSSVTGRYGTYGANQHGDFAYDDGTTN